MELLDPANTDVIVDLSTGSKRARESGHGEALHVWAAAINYELYTARSAGWVQ